MWNIYFDIEHVAVITKNFREILGILQDGVEWLKTSWVFKCLFLEIKSKPGAENFRAAHRLPQVTHRPVIWVPLSGQLDVERVNRQN